MIYMRVFWILVIIIFVVHYIVKKRVNEDKANDIALPISFVAISFLIVAIATKDPVFEPIGIPAGYEWIVGTSMGFLFLWKGYLDPMKSRLIEVEKDVAVLKNDVSYIKNDLHTFKTETKADLTLIKEKLLG